MEKGRRDESMRGEKSRERRREENRQRVIEERKCFVCGGFRHITHYCRNVREERPAQVPLNKFEVLKDRVMQRGEEGREEVRKDRKEILKEKRTKREVEIRQTKVERKEKKKKLLREMTVKIGLKQEDVITSKPLELDYEITLY